LGMDVAKHGAYCCLPSELHFYLFALLHVALMRRAANGGASAPARGVLPPLPSPAHSLLVPLRLAAAPRTRCARLRAFTRCLPPSSAGGGAISAIFCGGVRAGQERRASPHQLTLCLCRVCFRLGGDDMLPVGWTYFPVAHCLVPMPGAPAPASIAFKRAPALVRCS